MDGPGRAFIMLEIPRAGSVDSNDFAFCTLLFFEGVTGARLCNPRLANILYKLESNYDQDPKTYYCFLLLPID